MTRTYAQPYIDLGVDEVEQEARRIFEVIVRRWYGDESAPVIEYLPLPTYDEVVWSVESSRAEADEEPVLTSTGRSIDQVKLSISQRKVVRKHVRRLTMELMLRLGVSISPTTSLDEDGTFTLVWAQPGVPMVVLLTGDMAVGITQLQLWQDDELTRFQFTYERFAHFIACLIA